MLTLPCSGMCITTKVRNVLRYTLTYYSQIFSHNYRGPRDPAQALCRHGRLTGRRG